MWPYEAHCDNSKKLLFIKRDQIQRYDLRVVCNRVDNVVRRINTLYNLLQRAW